MDGKASVIQVLKLLESFETALLSQLLFREGSFTIGMCSSMMVVVGGAMLLLRLQPTSPAPEAVLAALASGLLFSCRNVLQRKHQAQLLQSQHPQAQITSCTNDIPPVKSRPLVHQDMSVLVNSVVQFMGR
jgi:drug/metabolite transporter (DMT)-like permease